MAPSKSDSAIGEKEIEASQRNHGVMLDSEKVDDREAHEVFKKSAEGVDFRTVSWYVSPPHPARIQPASRASLSHNGSGHCD